MEFCFIYIMFLFLKNCFKIKKELLIYIIRFNVSYRKNFSILFFIFKKKILFFFFIEYFGKIVFLKYFFYFI